MGSACELECETILSFDLAFITEAMQEQILEKLIQIKRMFGRAWSARFFPVSRSSAAFAVRARQRLNVADASLR